MNIDLEYFLFCDFLYNTNKREQTMAKLLDRTGYEYLRFRSWELHQKGWKQKQIAEALGVNQCTVSKWICKASSQGISALHTKKAPGSKSKLSPENISTLKKHIQAGAQYHGYPDNVWTNARIQKVILELFQINYSVQHVGRLLKTL